MLCSVNIIPQNTDKKVLEKISTPLLEKFHVPYFPIHLTIYGNLDMDYQQLLHIVKKTMNTVVPIGTEVEKLAYEDSLGKTLFIQLKKNNVLTTMFENLQRELFHYSQYVFNPHVSLLYKSGIPEEEKRKIAQGISLPEEIIFDAWSIITTDTSWDDISSWKTAYQQNL